MNRIYLFSTDSAARRFQQATDHLGLSCPRLGTAVVTDAEEPGTPTALDQILQVYTLQPGDLPLYSIRGQLETI